MYKRALGIAIGLLLFACNTVKSYYTLIQSSYTQVNQVAHRENLKSAGYSFIEL